jgi:hypothetical protein
VPKPYVVFDKNYSIQRLLPLFRRSLFHTCALPREDAMHILRDPVKGDIPWTGAFTGLSLLGLYVWAQDQVCKTIFLLVDTICYLLFQSSDYECT